ncbi:tyrosine-type recombinase/integrase [Nocardia fluminea]|uniref:tyrosine-type recombinase/integrase n=1 Tax=Nocardia fluminea TaxID=134984 RepID=UPI003651FC5D
MTRKDGVKDVVAWQTGTARLLPRLLAGRKRGPVFLADQKAKPAVAVGDIDPSTLRGRLSYRRVLELFEQHTAEITRGPFTLHQLRHSCLTHVAEDGASTPMLMRMSGHTSVRSLGKYARPSAEALIRWQAQTDPAARRRRLGTRPGIGGGNWQMREKLRQRLQGNHRRLVGVTGEGATVALWRFGG